MLPFSQHFLNAGRMLVGRSRHPWTHVAISPFRSTARPNAGRGQVAQVSRIEIAEPRVMLAGSAPVTSDVIVNARQGELVSVQLPGSDPDNEPITWSLDFPFPSTGTITGFDINTGVVDYQVDANAPASESIFFYVSDPTLDSATAELLINIAPNTEPTALDGSLAVDENSAGGTSVGTVSASDPENDALTYSILSGNGGGEFSINAATGEITVASGASLDFETTAAYQLVVEASDGIYSDTATIDIAINDVVESNTLQVDIDLVSLYGGPAFSSYEHFGALVIEGTSSFDVNDVDLNTLGFGATGTEDSLVSFWGHVIGFTADVDSDGDNDLVLLIDLSDLDASSGWNTLTLTGQLDNGTDIIGTTDEFFSRMRRFGWC